jgi:hypothetical protein
MFEDRDGDGNDELALNVGPSNPKVSAEGVNPGDVTPIHRVFTITYTDEEAAVYLTDGNDVVTFYRDDTPSRSLEGSDDAVGLGPDRTVVVSVLIDATDPAAPERIDDVTVHAVGAEPGAATTTDGPSTSDEPAGPSGRSSAQSNDDTGGESTPTETPTATPESGASGSSEGSTETPADPTETPVPSPTADGTPAEGSGGSSGEETATASTPAPTAAAGAADPPSSEAGFP